MRPRNYLKLSEAGVLDEVDQLAAFKGGFVHDAFAGVTGFLEDAHGGDVPIEDLGVKADELRVGLEHIAGDGESASVVIPRPQ